MSIIAGIIQLQIISTNSALREIHGARAIFFLIVGAICRLSVWQIQGLQLCCI
jgi:hypothetical protein